MTTAEQTLQARVAADAPSKKQRSIVVTSIWYVALTVLALLFFFPFFWTIMTSLKSPQEINVFPPTMFPETWRWENYVRVFEKAPVMLWVRNTLWIVIMGTLLVELV